MDPSLQKFLYNHTTNCIQYVTHVSMVHKNGKYYINDDDRMEFWELYYKVISENKPIGIGELPKQYLPILVDIDIKIPENNDYTLGEKIYSEEHVLQMIEIYQSNLRKIVSNCTEEDLTCVLLEKPSYRKGKSHISNGFHLHFPYIFLDKMDQNIYLLPRIIEDLKEYKIFEDIGIENSETVVDKCCTRNAWLLYGSSKCIDSEPYKITKVYDAETNVISLEEAFNNYELYDNNKKKIDIKGNIERYIPQILSTYIFHRKPNKIKNNLTSPLKKQILQKNPTKNDKYKEYALKQSLTVVRPLLNMLSDSRAENYDTWMEIGWILFNVTYGSPEGFQLWLDFSAKCQDKFNENTCTYEWSRMTVKNYTIGTLKYYANIDNPTAYKEFCINQAKHHINLCILGGSHYDIAQAMFSLYGDRFVCTSIRNNEWYRYIDNHWKKTEQGIMLQKKISTDICKFFESISLQFFKQFAESKEEKNSNEIEKMQTAKKMLGNLKSHPYKINIMKEAKEIFYNENFEDYLDNDPYIIGFKNGIYDLKNDKFREGRPEDYISKVLPINYTVFNEYDNRVQDVITFFERIFPDTSIREYFLDNASEIFIGNNPRKLFFMWTGHGDNGKSVTQELFEKMLGKYAIKIPTTLITGNKPASGSAWPELARAGKGVRWAVMEEPNSGERVNIGVLKSLTGNDTFIARDLYQRGNDVREITPMFKLIFICNNLPALNSADTATWNRIRVIPFETTFCKNVPETYEEQLKQKKFPVDMEFRNRIPDLLEPLAWFLLERKKKRIKLMIEPEKVKMATLEYKKKNDIYQQYLEECITVTEKDFKISLTEVYESFKTWCKNSLPGFNIPIKNDVKEHLIKIWGQPENGIMWKGFKLRTLEDDVRDGKVVILTEKDLIKT